jgi:hypothetical protein
MKNPKQLLCNQYNENLTNVSRTDKIGASDHLEMIEEEPKTVFKVGDKVYDSSRSEYQGTVKEIENYVRVLFDNDDSVFYTYLGTSVGCDAKVLSFKPYKIDVIQERPEKEIPKGTIVYCWDNDDKGKHEMQIGLYQGKNYEGNHITTSFVEMFNEGSLGYSWDNVSITNPLKD